MDMQNVSNLQIPEGMVKTIHDKDSRLLWGAVGYDTKYAGDTFQQTYSGKNIYKGARAFTVYDNNGIKITNDGTGALTFNGKATGNIYVNIIDNTNATTQANSKTNVVSGETYIASVAAPFPNNVSFRTNNLNYSLMTISKGATSSSSWTASATENNGLWCYVYITNGKEFNNDVLKVQVEKGSTATSYEPYVGGIASPNPDYPQDIQVVTGEQTVEVHGKNLFNMNSATITASSASASVVNNKLRVSNDYAGSSHFVVFKIGDTQDYAGLSLTLKSNWITSSTNTGRIYIGTSDSAGNNRTLLQSTTTSGESITATIPNVITSSNNTLILVFYSNNNSAQVGDYVDYSQTQLELGSSSTSYESFQSQSYTINLGSIELCKIGTYKDLIYRSGGDWYVHKETKKYDLSTITWVTDQTTLKRTNSNQISDIHYPASNSYVGVGLAEKYIMRMATGISGSIYLGYMGLTNNDRIIVNVGSGGPDPSGQAYFALATPTDIKITDSTLINQLNAVHQWLTRYGYNSTVSGNLPLIVDRTNL